ncbi:MAG TPA: SDR family NAD(P)-dependent oxidoreductase [Methylomirabilota bacterium]|nr:SDR family NAD(P)-dependent oxidoreductase [Methylomirabilota bacterium]
MSRPVALITGAGRGIGRATAEAFAAESWAVVAAELRPALGRRVEQALRRAGAVAVFVQTDVSGSFFARPGTAVARLVDRQAPAIRTAARSWRQRSCPSADPRSTPGRLPI